MIEPMAKLRLACPRRLGNRVAALLQETGVLQIESAPTEATRLLLQPQVMDEATCQRQAELRRLRDELQRLIQLLPEVTPSEPPSPGPPVLPDLNKAMLKQVADLVRQIGNRVDDLSRRLKACEDELTGLSKYEKAVETLAPFLPLLPEGENLDHVGVILREPEGQNRVLQQLDELIAKVTDNHYELHHRSLADGSIAVLLAFPKSYAAQGRALLWEEGIPELQLPASASDKPLAEALPLVLERKGQLIALAAECREALANAARTWRTHLMRHHEAAIQCLEQIEASRSFYRTELASFIYGWAPQRELGALIRRIAREFRGKVVVDKCPIGREEYGAVPVVLRNTRPFRPFETLTRLIALPRYGSIDPTPYLAVFFPIFYGLILGDIGYGLLLLLATAVVGRRYRHRPLIRDLSIILMAASASAIMFGFLFGELFGELSKWIGLRPVLNRMEAFLPLLYLSVGIGTLHVSLGIALGALGAWRQGERRESLVKLGGLALVSSFVCLIAGLAGLLPRQWMIWGLAGLIFSLAVVFGLGGARGALQLHNLVNVLSYLRLMGIGVASAALALAANKLGGAAGNLLLTLVVAGMLHAINLVFGLVAPTIHALRLHYVEFFENFFAAGGKPYRPFKRQKEPPATGSATGHD